MKTVHHTDEKELLRELREGSQPAFKRIFDSYYGPLCFFAGRIIGTAGLEEEIAEDCMFKLWERRENFQTMAQLSSFLYTSAKNSCLNELDKIKRRNNYLAQNPHAPEEPEHAIENHIIHSEVLRELYAAIETLPEQCRRILQMLMQQEMTPREVAAALDVSVSTVNNQKARAISLLRGKLSGSGFLLLLAYLNGHN